MFAQVKAALESTNQPYAVIEYPGDVRLIIAEYGGRLYGPFVGDEALCWINPATITGYQDFVASGEWNLGGERIWIAPELQYNIADRANFWETHSVPAQMDPGQHQLEQVGTGMWRISAAMTLQAYNLARGEKTLRVDRLIRIIPRPLPASTTDTTDDDLLFAGYEQVITLHDLNDTAIMSEIWNLVQLNPGGKLYIPVKTETTATLYFGDAPSQVSEAQDGYVQIDITGQRQFKIGYQAEAVDMPGRSLIYHNALPDGREYLLLRQFPNVPSLYIEEPPDQPGKNGHSVHVYNDGGQFGAFGELECNGRTIGGATGHKQTTDRFTMQVYIGPPEKIRAVLGR